MRAVLGVRFTGFSYLLALRCEVLIRWSGVGMISRQRKGCKVGRGV